ncbi:hypothetical protein K2173_003377 [Erythroxylum novogranatense]|uniref:1-phosphatidylinositol-4-phosphate 5-kinase n=1 Tax=Erythroxylum novogranatense TaxID=1862640 RepID=A0AAV8S8J1_9ROSI|nr:hypothetical protein K2173_003377 [Erythroxylum novogranatense]
MAVLQKEIPAFEFRDAQINKIRYCKQDFAHISHYVVTDYDWKDYCPVAFRRLRELENIDHTEYMLAICAEDVIREVSAPGKFGRLIILTTDERFVIKTLRKSEVKVMVDMLPNYYAYLKKNRASLLTKLYGIHVVKPHGGLKVYFSVLSTVIPSSVGKCKIYDLKGTPKGRKQNRKKIEGKVIYKDKDFDLLLHLDPLTHYKFLKQLRDDCEFLESEKIMDYSLLIGVAMQAPNKVATDGSCSCGQKAVPNSSSTAKFGSLNKSGEMCQMSNSPDFNFGMAMRARATTRRGGSAHPSIQDPRGCNVKLYFKIVDIFQNYGVSKRIEHVYKSLQYDSKSIAAVSPEVYSTRFQDYLHQIFQSEDSEKGDAF